MNLRGKRLLFLGGAVFQLPALLRAKRLGLHIILVDGNPDVPGRQFADTFEKISTSDPASVLAFASQSRIDGVMTFASDSSVPTVAEVAEKLGLPGNPPPAADTLRFKDKWREFQKENGLPHPPFFVARTVDEALAEVEKLNFPVVVKPVDSAGTRGQSVIYGKLEVHRALELALEASKVKRVIFENFIPSDRLELDGDIWFDEGRLRFRHYGHNHFLKHRISNVPSGERFPGDFPEELSLHIDGQFRTVINRLNLRSGVMNFDALAIGNNVHILDVGLRGGGNYVCDLIQMSTGFDIAEAAVFSALGQAYPCPEPYAKSSVPVASYLMGSRFAGRFEGFELHPQIQPFVVETRSFVTVGSPIKAYTRAEFAGGIALFKFPDLATMNRLMDNVEELVKLRVVPVRGTYKDWAGKPRPPRGTGSEGNASIKEFPELLSPFLREKMNEAAEKNDQTVLRVIGRQYIETPEERSHLANEGLKHYEASEVVMWEGERIYGVERLYRRVLLMEPLYQCAANCRHCLRRNYEPFNQTLADLQRIARYVGQGPGHEELREVLVTGGDPFLAPHKVEEFLGALATHAPQIRVVRVATRIPIQQPSMVNDRLLAVLGKRYPFRIEVGTQVNHAAELFPEVEEAYRKVLDVVGVVYNQTVLLKDVNDSLEELIELCDRLRAIGIENHYLFHCVPISGLNSMRTTLQRAIELARQLSSNGRISGRAKPQFVLMTDIGKITLYESTIIDHQENRYLLRSNYALEDRLKYNPTWQLPKTALVGPDGKLCVWYTDAAAEEAVLISKNAA